MDKLKLHSPDLTAMNIDKIAELFPHCITEAKAEDGSLKRSVDFDLLRQELSGDLVEGPQERYRLDWPGKREALATANAPIAKTLRPCRKESVEFDSTKNLYVEGDNLDALKLLQETYLGKVQMIYIDPPYNTGNDFIYDDNYSMSRADYKFETGLKNEDGDQMFVEEKWQQNSDANGRFHSEWLSMLYSRMKLSRTLLEDGGVIIVHIDEHEMANASKLMGEIFGVENRLGEIVWDKKNPKGDATKVAIQHEYLLAYTKSHEHFKALGLPKRSKENASRMLRKADQCLSKVGKKIVPNDLKKLNTQYDLGLNLESYKHSINLEDARMEYRSWLSKQDVSGGEGAYKFIDEEGQVYRPVSMAWPNKKQAPDDYLIPLTHPITGELCPVPERGWRNPSKTMKSLCEKGLILFGEDESKQPERKYLLADNLYENVPSVVGFGGSDDALFSSLGLTFDNPKPIEFAAQILSWFTPPGEGLFLDFFSGSATTAHAVMKLNAEDGGQRKHIQVQLPEPCEDNSAAFKAGYATIAEIGKERIRRAGAKIRAELEAQLEGELPESDKHQEITAKLANFDTGFRVLKIDSSNMADVYYTPDKVTQDGLDIQVENIKPDRTPEDLLFQVLLDWGVDLALPIEQETIDGKTVFFVDGNALAACFDPGLDEDFVKTLAKREPLRAVFRDASFATDATKINIEQIFKALSPHTELKAI